MIWKHKFGVLFFPSRSFFKSCFAFAPVSAFACAFADFNPHQTSQKEAIGRGRPCAAQRDTTGCERWLAEELQGRHAESTQTANRG